MIGSSTLDIIKINVEITKSFLTLCVSGDWHFGVKGITSELILEDCNKESDQHRNNIFRILTGDLIENALKTSIGHNYDIEIADPHDQKDSITKVLKEAMEYQYGKTAFTKLNFSKDRTAGCRAVGVLGNHEYRSRKLAGIWLDRDIYNQSKILSLGTEALLILKLTNKKLKMSKTYKIYVSHRPHAGSASSTEAIIRAINKKRGDIPGCDVYVFGHYHKRIIWPESHYDTESGKIKKVLYVVNPSPMMDAEYAAVNGFSPLITGYHVNCYLPIEENAQPWGII